MHTFRAHCSAADTLIEVRAAHSRRGTMDTTLGILNIQLHTPLHALHFKFTRSDDKTSINIAKHARVVRLELLKIVILRLICGSFEKCSTIFRWKKNCHENEQPSQIHHNNNNNAAAAAARRTSFVRPPEPRRRIWYFRRRKMLYLLSQILFSSACKWGIRNPRKIQIILQLGMPAVALLVSFYVSRFRTVALMQLIERTHTHAIRIDGCIANGSTMHGTCASHWWRELCVNVKRQNDPKLVCLFLNLIKSTRIKCA